MGLDRGEVDEKNRRQFDPRNPRTLTLTVGPDPQPMVVQSVPQVWIGTRSDDGLVGAR